MRVGPFIGLALALYGYTWSNAVPVASNAPSVHPRAMLAGGPPLSAEGAENKKVENLASGNANAG